jgi:hypothetical protein
MQHRSRSPQFEGLYSLQVTSHSFFANRVKHELHSHQHNTLSTPGRQDKHWPAQQSGAAAKNQTSSPGAISAPNQNNTRATAATARAPHFTAKESPSPRSRRRVSPTKLGSPSRPEHAPVPEDEHERQRHSEAQHPEEPEALVPVVGGDGREVGAEDACAWTALMGARKGACGG